MLLDNELKLDYSDVLIRPKRSTLGSRKEVDLNRKFTYVNLGGAKDSEYDYDGVPIMAANMDGVGTMEMADELSERYNMFTCLVKTYSAEELIDFFNPRVDLRTEFVAMSIGITKADKEKLAQVYNKTQRNLKYVCVDVANGYSERFVQFIKFLREHYPFLVIIAGNVVTADQTQELILNGADIVKVGIGPGSVCTTRIQTGVGYPQLSAVIECADAAHGLGGHIIADGGCTCPGDVAKAFAAGSDFVMLGGMLAGHDEGGGEIITKYYQSNELRPEREAMYGEIPEKRWFEEVIEEKKFVQFYGMSSKAANDKHFGGLKEYRSSEGRDVLVPYRGKVINTLRDILGGIRSTCTYVGARKLKQLSKCTTFVRCTNQYNGVYANN
jgi:GMP reductase